MINYDINTEEGMRNAIEWTERCLGKLKDGGVWYVPRSCTVVQIISHDRKELKLVSIIPDRSIRLVLAAAGWTFIK